MGSAAILQSWLQPLPWVGYMSWGLVAEGTNSGLAQY